MGLILSGFAFLVVMTVFFIVIRGEQPQGIRLKKKRVPARGIRVSCLDGKTEIGHAYLYIFRNDIHAEPLGFLEDVEVDAKHRGKGVFSRLHALILEAARANGCYKIIACSRSERAGVHDMYRHLGYEAHGIEFRLDLILKN